MEEKGGVILNLCCLVQLLRGEEMGKEGEQNLSKSQF